MNKQESYIKNQLYSHCNQSIQNQAHTYQQAIDNAQQAANSESKSTAGDKYETGRAMIHRDIQTYGLQLVEVMEFAKIMRNISPFKDCSYGQMGAVLETSMGNFYIAISADEIEIEGNEYCPISLLSPVGSALNKAKAGDIVPFRESKITIIKVY